MLTATHATTMVPVKDERRAVRFYHDVLGLKAEGRSPGGREVVATEFDTIYLYPSDEPPRAEHTMLSFEVPDVREAVERLSARGVTFETYDAPELTTVEGVATIGDEQCAWFKDSEGNLLCVHARVYA